MIHRIDKRLSAWAEQIVGGYGGGHGSSLGAMIEGRTAEFVSSKRRRVREKSVVRITDAFGIREVNRASCRPAIETATGTQSIVPCARRVNIDNEVMDVAKAVDRLGVKNHEVVHVFYFDGELAVEVRAKKLNISRMTMYRRLDAAHVILDSMLYGSVLPRVSDTYPQAACQR